MGQENPLEESKATHSSILAWRIPWTEEAGGLQSVAWGCNEWDTTEATQHDTCNVVYSNRNSILEARSLKARSQEGHDLSEEARGGTFSPLVVSECQQSLTFFCLTDVSLKSLPLPSHGLHRCFCPCLCAQIFSYRDTSPWI